MTVRVLFAGCFISCLLCPAFVSPVYYIFNVGIDFLIGHYIFGGINKEDVSTLFRVFQIVFLFSPCLADAPFQEVALDCSLEKFLRNRDQNSAESLAVVCQLDITKRTDTAMSAAGKKFLDVFLAAQSFLFRKSVMSLPVHFGICFI